VVGSPRLALVASRWGSDRFDAPGARSVREA
jgi:hypothetical protein